MCACFEGFFKYGEEQLYPIVSVYVHKRRHFGLENKYLLKDCLHCSPVAEGAAPEKMKRNKI